MFVFNYNSWCQESWSSYLFVERQKSQRFDWGRQQKTVSSVVSFRLFLFSIYICMRGACMWCEYDCVKYIWVYVCVERNVRQLPLLVVHTTTCSYGQRSFVFCYLYHDSVVVVVVVVLMILCWCCFSWFVVVRLCLRAAAAAQRLRLAVLLQAVRLQLKASVALIIAFKPINLCDLLQHQLIISLLFFSLSLYLVFLYFWYDFVYTAAKEEEEEEEVISTHFFFLFLFIRIFTYYYFPSFNYNSLMKKWALICSIKLDFVGLSSCLLQKKKKNQTK